jgi:DNA polymerase delta subunit 2
MLDTLETNLEKFSNVIPTDMMPGDLELSTSFLPQQPLSQCLFPNLQDRLQSDVSKNLTFVTNPHSFEIGSVQLLGTSGQNVKDIRMYASEFQKHPLKALNLTLEMRHLFPTSPDTLRSFPFVDKDPFVVKDSPNVYFAGN